MAVNTNTITITGNLTRDPELRFTPSGQATCSFGVAVNRRWQNRQTNEWEEAVSFFDVTVWQQMAENVAQSMSKGDRVCVTGRLEQRSWEAQDGERRYKIEIVADDVAASFKYATAQMTRNERRGGAPAADGPEDYGQRREPARTAAPPAPYDEEPF